ncbi:MAG TPA: hypothetical protein VKK30_05260 [Actinomycetota bacterium]|nr:hypothetical protein [Actinomycetota bacterium]
MATTQHQDVVQALGADAWGKQTRSWLGQERRSDLRQCRAVIPWGKQT